LWQSGFEIVSFTIFDKIKCLSPLPLQQAGSFLNGGRAKEEEGKIFYVLCLGFKKGIESHH
jgi:hypothetical protein